MEGAKISKVSLSLRSALDVIGLIDSVLYKTLFFSYWYYWRGFAERTACTPGEALRNPHVPTGLVALSSRILSSLNIDLKCTTVAVKMK